MKVTVALGQIRSRLGDIEHNLDGHLRMIDRARESGAGLIVFPELSLTGYYLREMVPDKALTVDSDVVAQLAAAADGIGVIAGFVEESDDHCFYNSAFFAMNGRIEGVHRKIYLPDYGMFEEGRYFAAGGMLEPFDAPFGRIGILICEDTWHPRLAAELAGENVTLLVNLSASPVKGVPAGEGVRNRAVNAGNNIFYARTFGIPVVFMNKVGYEHGVCFWGGSALFLPDGSCPAECSMSGEDLVLAEYDTNDIRRARTGFPYLRDERGGSMDNWQSF